MATASKNDALSQRDPRVPGTAGSSSRPGTSHSKAAAAGLPRLSSRPSTTPTTTRKKADQYNFTWDRPGTSVCHPFVGVERALSVTDPTGASRPGTGRLIGGQKPFVLSGPVATELEAEESLFQEGMQAWQARSQEIDDLAEIDPQPSAAVTAAALDSAWRFAPEGTMQQMILPPLLQHLEAIIYHPGPATGETLLGDWRQEGNCSQPPELERSRVPEEVSWPILDAVDRYVDRAPYFAVAHWQQSRMAQLQDRLEYLATVKKRSEYFENLQVQAKTERGLGSFIQGTAFQTQVSKTGSKLIQRLKSGRFDVCLVWLWGFWKFFHLAGKRAKCKKGALLDQTMIGDTLRPFVHWVLYLFNRRIIDKRLTRQAFETERHMLVAAAADIENKKEQVAAEFKVNEAKGKRLALELEREKSDREALALRLVEAKPELVKQMLCKVLDHILLRILPEAMLHRTMSRLHIATREMAGLLKADEESLLRLCPLDSQQLLGRWVSHHVMHFKLLASDILESLARVQMEEGTEQDRAMIEWSSRETEVFSDRCRVVRNLGRIASFEEDFKDGAILAVLYAAIIAGDPKTSGVARELNPAGLWPLDHRVVEERAFQLVKLVRLVLPTQAVRCLLQPSDITKGNVQVLSVVLASICLHTPRLPCGTNQGFEIVGCAVAASAAAAQIDADSIAAPASPKERSKPMKADSNMDNQRRQKHLQRTRTALFQTPADESELGLAPSVTIRQRFYQDAVSKWLSEDLEGIPRAAVAPSEGDSKYKLKKLAEKEHPAKQVCLAIDLAAGHFGFDEPQDFSKLLEADEAMSDLLGLYPHEVLLRWINFHLGSASIRNLSELKGGAMLLGILKKVAADVLELMGEELTEFSKARGSMQIEAASRRVCLACASRCVGYQILSVEALKDDQADVIAAFLAELMLNHSRLPADASSPVRRHKSAIASVVREASQTDHSSQGQCVQALCLFLQGKRREFQQAIAWMKEWRDNMQQVQLKMKRFAAELLSKRARGKPCNLERLTQQNRGPSDGAAFHLVSPERLMAIMANETVRQSSDVPYEALEQERLRVEDVLKKYIGTFRDLFRQYAIGKTQASEAQEPSPTTDPKNPRVQKSTLDEGYNRNSMMDVEKDTVQVLVVNLRALTHLHRDCRLKLLKLLAIDMEDIYNELKLQEARQASNADSATAEAPQVQLDGGLSLELFVEAMVTTCCRCSPDIIEPLAFAEKLSFIIEHHLEPFALVREKSVLNNHLHDPGIERLMQRYRKTLRTVFFTYSSGGGQVKDPNNAAPVRKRQALKITGAAVGVLAPPSKTINLEDFKRLLDHAGMMGQQQITSSTVNSIFKGLLEQQEGIHGHNDDGNESVAGDDEESEDVQSEMGSKAIALVADFAYEMCYQEFIDGLVVLTLYREPNLFLNFIMRFERLLRQGIIEPLAQFWSDKDKAGLEMNLLLQLQATDQDPDQVDQDDDEKPIAKTEDDKPEESPATTAMTSKGHRIDSKKRASRYAST